MDKLIITGGARLEGQIRISGAKNSALPAMAACLLTPEEVLLSNMPLVADIRTTRRLLGELGVQAEFEDPHSLSSTQLDDVFGNLVREPGGGLLVMPDNFMEIHRAQIISLAARDNVPAVYQLPVNVRDGGLLSYGADFVDVFRRAAPYVDRVLRGTMPSELPVQMPTK